MFQKTNKSSHLFQLLVDFSEELKKTQKNTKTKDSIFGNIELKVSGLFLFCLLWFVFLLYWTYCHCCYEDIIIEHDSLFLSLWHSNNKWQKRQEPCPSTQHDYNHYLKKERSGCWNKMKWIWYVLLYLLCTQ